MTKLEKRFKFWLADKNFAPNRLKNIMLQNMYYRTDIGKKWGEESDKLQTWGYLY